MPSDKHRIRVALSVTNDICYDQRIIKMSEVILNLGCEVTIIGRRRGKCRYPDHPNMKIKRFRMLFNRGFLFYKFYNIRLFLFLMWQRFDILVSNDLDTLAANYLSSVLKNIPLVYDSHEYFTGVPELNNRPFVTWVWKSIERIIIPRLSYFITVSDPIASLYEKEYGIKPLVVRNISKYASHIIPYSREDLGVPEDDLLLIIQGKGINVDKGAEELVEAVGIMNGVSLLVVGWGDVLPDIMEKVKELEINSRVRFIPPVEWEILMRYTKSADLGMCLEKDTNINYRYSLPNKLFEYIAAGIPVVTSNLPETGKIIRENSCGLIIDEVSPVNIASVLREIMDDPEKWSRLKRNALQASDKYTWENESIKIRELYNELINKILRE